MSRSLTFERFLGTTAQTKGGAVLLNEFLEAIVNPSVAVRFRRMTLKGPSSTVHIDTDISFSHPGFPGISTSLEPQATVDCAFLSVKVVPTKDVLPMSPKQVMGIVEVKQVPGFSKSAHELSEL